LLPPPQKIMKLRPAILSNVFLIKLAAALPAFSISRVLLTSISPLLRSASFIWGTVRIFMACAFFHSLKTIFARRTGQKEFLGIRKSLRQNRNPGPAKRNFPTESRLFGESWGKSSPRR
jgi:hypothetical protein